MTGSPRCHAIGEAKGLLEEPYGLMRPRICGSPGRVTAQGHPAGEPESHAIEPRKSIVVGAFVVPCTGATRAFRNWSGTHRPAGVGEHGQTGMGVPQELGSSCRLHGSQPGRGYRATNPRLAVATRSDGGSERCVIPWYRQVKETKCGGKGGRKSQCLDSTEEAGELGPRGPGGREARHQVTRPSTGTTQEASNFCRVSPQR